MLRTGLGVGEQRVGRQHELIVDDLELAQHAGTAHEEATGIIAGDVAGRLTQIRMRVFLGNHHRHVGRGRQLEQ